MPIVATDSHTLLSPAECEWGSWICVGTRIRKLVFLTLRVFTRSPKPAAFPRLPQMPAQPPAHPTRREILKAGGVGLLTFTLGGSLVKLSPAQAQAAGVPLAALTQEEANTLAALGERLVPGSREAGVVPFVDYQLAASPADCMLMIQYLGVDPPFTPFYREGLAALDAAAQARHKLPFAKLKDAPAEALIDALAEGKIEGWAGPPPPFFYFVVRNDACDVTYGTEKGFAALGVPYAAHIMPPSEWGEPS